MHPEETKVHRRGLMLVPGLAANHEAQPPFYLTVQEMCRRRAGKVFPHEIDIQEPPPSIVNLTVKRRYLTEREVERLMDCARKHGRYGHRDATMILVAYRHGLRASP